MKQHYILTAIVVVLLMLLAGSYLLKATAIKDEIEGFATTNVKLNFCPSWAPQEQTAKGNTDCCEGDFLNGKCNGKTFCTLSPSHDGVPTCTEAWKKYFETKSKDCPVTMPNYYEDVKNANNPKGCSSSTILDTGINPTNLTAPKCRIYKTEKENREKTDSCFVEKERLTVQCPAFAGYTSKVEMVTYRDAGVEKYGSFVCSYTNPLGQRNSCNDEKTLISMWDRQNPNWRLDNSKYTQLNNISCRTFLERERKKELERQRIEALRRQAEEERNRREAMANRFRSFFNRFRQAAQNQADKIRKALEDAKRKAQQDRDAAARKMRDLQNRLKVCK